MLNQCFVFLFCFFTVSVSVCFQCVCSGILIGSGMQKIAALSNLVCYYCIGLPVGIALMFAAELRILGKAFTPFYIIPVFANKNEINSESVLHVIFFGLGSQL